jgi:hypothetical protein
MDTCGRLARQPAGAPKFLIKKKDIPVSLIAAAVQR